MSNTKKESFSYQQSGFVCAACGTHTKTYYGVRPVQCPGCLAEGTMRMTWNQFIEVESTVHQLELEK